MDGGDPVGADPPQLRPILVVVVDEEAHLWVALDVGQAAQPLRGLRFGVHRGVDDPVVQCEHHRHQVWTSVGGGGGQSGYRRLREAGLGVEVGHA